MRQKTQFKLKISTPITLTKQKKRLQTNQSKSFTFKEVSLNRSYKINHQW